MEIQDASGTGSRAATARLPAPRFAAGKGSRSIVLFLKRDPDGLLASCETRKARRAWIAHDSAPKGEIKKQPACPPAVFLHVGASIDYSRWCLPCMHLPAATV